LRVIERLGGGRPFDPELLEGPERFTVRDGASLACDSDSYAVGRVALLEVDAKIANARVPIHLEFRAGKRRINNEEMDPVLGNEAPWPIGNGGQ
jgi:hypothetical protein